MTVSLKNALVLFFLFTCSLIYAQPQEQNVKVVVAPNHTDWIYKTGEQANFTITVLQYGNPVKNVALRYELGPEKMDAQKKDSLSLSSGTLAVNGGTMRTPGFLRLIAIAYLNGKQYRGLATAAFEPEKIMPTVANPQDFKQFWDKAKTDLAAVPLDARMTLLPERCTEKVNVYHVNLQNIGNSRLYGILCVPKKEGKYPA
ncbi:MAG: acetylxylan esterase, partial [Flavisolibacter sp.]|nr:acetylxylan esterase [Flavisolibacter sp.]